MTGIKTQTWKVDLGIWGGGGVGWEGVGEVGGRRYRDVCICIAYSLCYKAETNTPL